MPNAHVSHFIITVDTGMSTVTMECHNQTQGGITGKSGKKGPQEGREAYQGDEGAADKPAVTRTGIGRHIGRNRLGNSLFLFRWSG